MNLQGMWLYFVVVLGVVLLPGMDMAFVVASSLSAGTRAGIAATAGIALGGIFHVVLVGTGLAVLLRAHPAILPTMLVVGAAYLGWIGCHIFRAGSAALPDAATPAPSLRRTFLRAIATCLLNPKAYLFLLAVFPQFVGAGQLPVARIAAMALITATTQGAVYGTAAVMAGKAHRRLRRHPGRMRWLVRAIGAVLAIMACAMMAKGVRDAVGGKPRSVAETAPMQRSCAGPARLS